MSKNGTVLALFVATWRCRPDYTSGVDMLGCNY
jgi:hypothetical protein